VTGPVQVMVVGFDGLTLSGEVMAEFDRLREAGTARLLDVLWVERAEDGTMETLPAPAGAAPGLGDLAASILGASDPDVRSAGEPADGSTWSLADAIPVGTTAAVALIEHLWAAPLSDAIVRAGGKALEETWLDREDVTRLEQLLGGSDT
jgi:Family of unknown function (DUF6325)